MSRDIQWAWKSYLELTKDELYSILKFRQEIFAVEQKSWYLDVDGLDQDAHHLLGFLDNDIVGYLRLLRPKKKYSESLLGRILIHKKYRGSGSGHFLVQEGIRMSKKFYPDSAIKISAQEHLENFYNFHDFHKIGQVYDEDGIPHISMLLK